MRSHRNYARPFPAAAALLIVFAFAMALMRPAWVLQYVFGFSCRADVVCTDDAGHLQEASDLYSAAMRYVTSNIAPLKGAPLAVFCSTQRCYAFAGTDGSAAKTVGRFIIVISPRGWKPHFVRHELIHRLQAETLGMLEMYGKPRWYVEGMAYALSEDPRERLIEPFESDRTRFENWYVAVGKKGMWSASTGP